MSKNIKRLLIAIIILLFIVYTAGVIYFSENTYPKTKINNIDKGLVSVNDIFKFDINGYKLSIKGKDNKQLDVKSSDIELKKEVTGKPSVNQNIWLWPIEVFQSHKYDVDIVTKFNETKLENIIKSSDFFKNIVEPVDAKLEIDDNNVLIIEEVEGNKLDQEKLISSIKSSIQNEKTDLELKDEYILPKVYKNNKSLVSEYDRLSKIYKTDLVFDLVDRKYELSGKKLLDMYTKDSNGRYIMDRDKLTDFIAEIAKETDTYNTPHKFNATGLGEITVPGGIYGWLMDVHATADVVEKMISEEKSGNVEIAYLRTANERGIDDIGDTYIEIDLSRQTMWFYKDGELFAETPIVSGDIREGKGSTPKGVNMIWSKEKDVDLVGNNAYYGTSYNIPVKYWMPVGWTGSGLHDSSWRNAYGGDIYKTGGGSGCINTPPEVMEKIYNNVPLHTAVVIYESSTDYSPTEFERQEQIRKGEAKLDVVR